MILNKKLCHMNMIVYLAGLGFAIDADGDLSLQSGSD